MIDQLRQVVLWQAGPDWGKVGLLWLSGIIMFQIGFWGFQKLRMDFADVL